MHLDPDDARTDVVLAGAAAVLGGTVRGIVGQLPGYPRQGAAALLLELGWILAVTGLVPLLLARHRRDRVAAFGLGGRRDGLAFGAVLAVPVVAAQLVLGTLIGVSPRRWLPGRIGPVLAGGADVWTVVASLGGLVLLTLGATLLVAFVARRSADGFPRSPELPVSQLVRTVGLGAAAVALVAGMLRTITGPAAIPVLLNVVAAVAILLLVDRRLPAGARVARSAVVVPVVVVGLMHLFATGGLFRGDLVTALYAGGLGAAVAVAAAALAVRRRTAWAVVGLMLAVHWWPSCLSPLALEVSGAC